MLEQLTSGGNRLFHLNMLYRYLPWMISVGVEDKLERTTWDQLYREGPRFRAPELPHSVRDSVGKKAWREKRKKKKMEGCKFCILPGGNKNPFIIQHSADPKGLTQESCYARPNMDLGLHLAPAASPQFFWAHKRSIWKLTDLFIWTSAILIES